MPTGDAKKYCISKLMTIYDSLLPVNERYNYMLRPDLKPDPL